MRKIYEWDDWFSLGEFTLVQGTHFFCTPFSALQQVRGAASLRRLAIEVTPAEDCKSFTVKVVGRSLKGKRKHAKAG